MKFQIGDRVSFNGYTFNVTGVLRSVRDSGKDLLFGNGATGPVQAEFCTLIKRGDWSG